MADIFISYSRLDHERCDAIDKVLTREGYSVAVDYRSIETGARYRERIEEEIAQATAIIVLWSEHSNDSDFVVDEVDLAKQAGKVVLPLIIDDTSEAPVLGFSQLQALR